MALALPTADRKGGPGKEDVVCPAEGSLHSNARMHLSQGVPAPRPQGVGFRVRGVKVPGPAEPLGGAPRTEGLLLTSSWGTISPWLGVNDDYRGWQVRNP